MSEIALQVQDVSKRYQIYERPQDRLRQAVIPRLERMLGMRRADTGRFFREFWALRNVSLQVARGEALGILGRNGAGKSTLLQIIAGTLTPSSGTVSLSGKVAALLELGSGFAPDFTGAENIRLNATLLGLSAAQIEERFASIVEFADIGDFIDQPVKTYSSGMLLRVAFAVQTAVEPDILIVDEALAVGDARFQKKCFTRIEQLLSRGTTILFVTHDTGSVVQFCSRAVILEQGSVYGDGNPMQIAREYHRLLFDQTPPPAMAAPSARVAAPATTADAAATSESAPDGAVSAAASGAGGSARETRYGSRAVEIHAIGIRGPSGTETRVLEIHDACTFYFQATYRESISTTVGFGFIISNVKGVEVFGTRARQFDRILPPSEQGAIYECAIRVRVPMIPGTYFLTAAIAYDDENGPGEFLDFRFDALEFQVVGHPRCFTTGMVDLDAELTYERLDGVRNAVRPGQ